MATFEVAGVSPVRPVEHMTSLPEGGIDAAVAAASVLFPGRRAMAIDSGTWANPYVAIDTDLLLATWGPTAVLLGRTPEPNRPPGAGLWSYTHQTTSDSHAVEVDAAPVARVVALSPGRIEVDEGEKLAFETPFWAGERDIRSGETPAFDPDAWGAAAMVWLFGYDPGRTLPGPFDAATQPLHTIRLV